MSAVTVISDINELKRIAGSRPAKTMTYRVTKEVAEANLAALRSNPAKNLVPLTRKQNTEMADYLGVAFREVEMLSIEIEPVKCPSCGRDMTITDLIHQAVTIGKHDRRFVVDNLVRNTGNHFITVDGVDDADHVMRCLNCGVCAVDVKMFPSYTCMGRTSYAHCAW